MTIFKPNQRSISMSELETTSETTPEIDLIETIFEGQSPSLSGRSTLTFAIGRHPDGTLHLRIVGNSGGGMFCDEWIEAAAIDAIVIGATGLTSASFQVLKPGRSTNTAGFAMAALRSMGLIRANAENTRLHEHVPTETFEKVAMTAIDPGASPKKSKALKTKLKETP
jgi:hypothetical protein